MLDRAPSRALALQLHSAARRQRILAVRLTADVDLWMEEARSRARAGPEPGAAALRADRPPTALALSLAAHTLSSSVISGPGPHVTVKECRCRAWAHAGGCASVPGLVGEPLWLLPAPPTLLLATVQGALPMDTSLR